MATSSLQLMRLHVCHYYRAQQEEGAGKTLALSLECLYMRQNPELSLG